MKKATIFLLFLLATLFYSSCNNDPECVNCFSEESGTRKIALGTNDLTFKYWIGSSENSSDKDSYQLYIKEGNLSELTIESSKFYDITIKQEKNKINAIVFYTNSIFKDNDVIKNSDIIGYQIYFEEDSYLKTNVFEYKNNTATLIQELSSFIDYFSFNDIYNCSRIFESEKNSVFIYFNNEMKTTTKRGNSNFKSNLGTFKSTFLFKNDEPVFIDPDEKKCKSPCSNLRSAVECTRVNDSPRPDYYKCVTSACPWEHRVAETEEESFKVREFRDTELALTITGQKYIDYYYDLAEYSDQFSQDNWEDLIGLKTFILDKIVVYTLNIDNDYFIDDDEKQLLQNIILKLKNVSTDQEYINMLDNVISDLNQYSNKIVTQIKSEIN